MTKPRIYTIRRRGTYRFVLASPHGTDLTATARGNLRLLADGETEVDPDEPVAAEWDVSAFAGDETRGPGFYLELDAEATEGLEAGRRYLADAIVTISGSDFVQSSWIVAVLEPATVAVAP